MSTTQIQSNHTTTVASTQEVPDNEKLHRLLVETGKYLGLNTGDPLDTAEIIAQGEANGYTESEVCALLESEGYASAESILVPPQGDVLGEIWRTQAPQLSAQNTEQNFLEKFSQWCDKKREDNRSKACPKCDESWVDIEESHCGECGEEIPEDADTYQHALEHSYSYESELQKYAKAKDVERYFGKEYDKYTTILITYTLDREEGESVVEHANRFYEDYPVCKKRRSCFRETGFYDEYAGVSLLAPKDIAPHPTAERTHAHDLIVFPTFVSSKYFDELRQIEGVDVSIRYHRSDKVRSPPSVNRLDLEQERGETSALPHELGANLPVLSAIETETQYKASLDATHCPEYVERWCAHMSCGKDGDPSTNGVRRWRPLGRFEELAELMKEEREDSAQGMGAIIDLTETQEEFVEEYVEAGLSTDRDTVARTLEKNINEFGGYTELKPILAAIQRLDPPTT